MFCTLLALAFVHSHKSDAKEQVYELWKTRDDLEDLCSKDVALLSLREIEDTEFFLGVFFSLEL